jgi:hypothetical protein
MSFRHKSDYHRHSREVHNERADLMSNNRCPHTGCERSRQGFARRWNLRDHYRRCHGGELPSNIRRSLPDRTIEPTAAASQSELGAVKVEPVEAFAREEEYIAPKKLARTVPVDSSVQTAKRHCPNIATEVSMLKAKCEGFEAQLGAIEKALTGLKSQAISQTRDLCGGPPS